MINPLLSRRRFLTIGCSAAASPLFTPLVAAAAPGDNRFVAIILRGAMDGLDILQPYGDPSFAALRGGLARKPGAGLTDLDGFFGLHQTMDPLMGLWRAGELAFVHAVSTPYRQGRSHFDGQDVLETGMGAVTGSKEGWLNRFVAGTPGARETYAVSVGRSPDLILQGPGEFTSWAVQTDLQISPDAIGRLQAMYRKDPLFAEMLERALQIDAITDELDEEMEQQKDPAALAAQLLRGDSRIASFSIGGWDTHINQGRAILRPMEALARALVTLKTDLGPDIWARTGVIAMTEFGRTARPNGADGTDHGTGGLAILAGGAIAGGRVYGQWPGLSDGNLFENRDLTPTEDVRRYAAWMLRGLYGADPSALEYSIFPGLGLGMDPGIIRV